MMISSEEKVMASLTGRKVNEVGSVGVHKSLTVIREFGLCHAVKIRLAKVVLKRFSTTGISIVGGGPEGADNECLNEVGSMQFVLVIHTGSPLMFSDLPEV
jgi:hypothetical protein